jgi:CheY-like chemotaxis protein/nitrogen-specific signal transduction histidine kinase
MSGVCMMVTRRKEAELARLATAEEASRLKDEFLATLSHELRTPLNAILGWTEMLRSGELPADRVRHAIDVISRNARLQAQLIEDILDVSRIITGKLELDRRPLAVPNLVDTAIAAVQPAAEARQITFQTRLGDVLPFVEGDPKRLHQVLTNVLANAVKFSNERGRIEVQVDSGDGQIRIEVRDHGAGIAPEFLPHVFERFRQADSRSTRRHGGLGLGLAIARHLVELHGGAIQAESVGLGHGTTVIVSLPLVSDLTAGSIAGPGAARVAEDVRLDGRRVLVVDDQQDSCDLLAMLLEQRGATVLACDSAGKAVERLRDGRIDLLIADIAMPEMDGYRLIRDLRQRGVELPAVAVTAYARPDDRRRALASGYSAYCAKPIDARVLLRTVHALLEARSRTTEQAAEKGPA